MRRVAAHLRRVFRQEGGFSLIEMLTALSILLTVIGALTVLMVSATKSEVDLTKRVQAQQQARLALEQVRHQIHEACVVSHINLATGAIFTPSPPGAFSNVRLTPPTASGCPVVTNPATAVTWCMSGSGNRWTLRQIGGTPMTCAGGRIEADYVTKSDVFTIENLAGSLAALKVDFPIDLEPLSAVGGTYRLEDRLILRNSTRNP
jgi:type II secretory pathway pseudopilin PulG